MQKQCSRQIFLPSFCLLSYLYSSCPFTKLACVNVVINKIILTVYNFNKSQRKAYYPNLIVQSSVVDNHPFFHPSFFPSNKHGQKCSKSPYAQNNLHQVIHGVCPTAGNLGIPFLHKFTHCLQFQSLC